MGSKAKRILGTGLLAAVGGGVAVLLAAAVTALMGMEPLSIVGFMLSVPVGAAVGAGTGVCVERREGRAGLRHHLVASPSEPSSRQDFHTERTGGSQSEGKRIRVVAEPGYDRPSFRIPVRMTA